MKAAHGALAGLLAILANVTCAGPVGITWRPAEVGPLKSPHGALLIPVGVGDLQCLMQLDTGAGTVFYRETTPAGWVDKAGDSVTVPDLSIGGTRIPAGKFPIFPGAMFDGKSAPCSPTNRDVVIGTIGLDTLKTGSIVIDMPAARFEFIAHGVLSTSTSAGAPVFRFASLEGVDASIPLFELTGRNGGSYKMMLDTGSAPVGAMFYREPDWLAGTTSATRTKPFQIVRWGQPASCRYGQGKLAIPGARSSLQISDRIFFCDRLGEQVGNGDKMSGLIGLLPFEMQRLTIDFVDRLASVEASR